MMFRRLTVVMGLVASALAAGVPAHAQENFYAGKTISMVVGFPPGGGNDLYARLLARHIGKFIPGNPSVIVQNMPGAASLTAVRALDTSLPKDGTQIAVFTSGLILESITTPDKIKLNFSDFAWLGSISRDVRVCYMWNGTGIKSWDDLLKKDQIVMGDSGTSGYGYVSQSVLKRMFGVKIKVVTGYAGSAEKRIALERGEIDGDCGIWETIPADWLRDKKVSIVLRFSEDDARAKEAGAPYVRDLAKTDNDRKVLDLLNAGGEFGRPYIVSKSVPADRVKLLRDAFDKTMRDGDFLSEAEKQKLGVSSLTGLKSEAIVRDVYAASPEVVTMVKEIMGQ
jgi:tripartite-type tricarboxylate transporter receptor subunit TctC